MTTTTHHRNRQQASGPAAYLGWHHGNSRMELMDLPSYLDSLQRSYDTLQQAYGSMAAAMPGAAPWVYSPATGYGAPAPGGSGQPTGHAHPHRHVHPHGHPHGHPHDHPHERGRHGRDCDCGCDDREKDCGCDDHHGHDHHDHGRDHDHDHHDHHRHDHDHERHDDCGCGPSRSCRCDCCVEDADIVVYAHCGEIRIVPIEIENDTRKAREDVTLEISDVRTAGGRVLPWRTNASVDGPLTLDACSTTRVEVAVRILCQQTDQTPGQPPDQTPGQPGDAKPAAKAKAAAAQETDDLAAAAWSRISGGDVDDCVVGYFTVRFGGCLTRPIVVAVAALPYSCDSYRTGCSCTCCC